MHMWFHTQLLQKILNGIYVYYLHNLKRCRRSFICLQSTSLRVLRTKCQKHVNTTTKYTYLCTSNCRKKWHTRCYTLASFTKCFLNIMCLKKSFGHSPKLSFIVTLGKKVYILAGRNVLELQ